MLSDISRLGKIIAELPTNPKIVGIAYLLEEPKSRIKLDQIVKECIFSDDMIYPKIFQVIPSLKLPTRDDLYYIELKGWKNRKSKWTTKWDLVANIHDQLE